MVERPSLNHLKQRLPCLNHLNHLFLYVHEDANFDETDEGMQKPINQDGLVTQLLFMGNMLCNNRRKEGKVSGLT